MEIKQIEQNFVPVIESSSVLLTPTWDKQIAAWVSRLSSPPLLVAIGIALAAASIGSSSAWLWAAFYTALAILLPVIYIVWKVQRGEIADFHIKERSERIRPMLLTLILSSVGWLVMWWAKAPLTLSIFAGAGVIQVAFLLGVTLRWKISGHSTAAAGFAVFVLALFGRPATPILLLIPLVVWARMHRHRHDLAQTIAGSLAGIAYMLVVLYLVNLNGLTFSF